MWRIMPHLDVLWNGSENRGQSIAILEAMAAGVPVVASDTPMNREFVVEGETGYLIPLGTRAGRATAPGTPTASSPTRNSRCGSRQLPREHVAEHFDAGTTWCRSTSRSVRRISRSAAVTRMRH